MKPTYKYRHLVLSVIFALSSTAQAAGPVCKDLFAKQSLISKVTEKAKSWVDRFMEKNPEAKPPQVEKVTKVEQILPQVDPKTAWENVQKGIADVREIIEGGEDAMTSLLTAFLAKEFVWVNGDPGGAKTFISRLLMDAELRTIPLQSKKTFLLQFHKLLSESVITGSPVLKKMLENGEFERNIDNALIADKYIFLIADEVEKSSPALQATLLSVLAERKAFLGSEVVDTLLTAGVFTSNKTIGQVIEAAGLDRAAIEALMDRMAIKHHLINQQVDIAAEERMLDKIEKAKAQGSKKPELGVLYLRQVLDKVEVPVELFAEFSKVKNAMDEFYNEKLSEAEALKKAGKPGYIFFPPNQFSNRSTVKLFEIWKASFIVRQLMEGVPYEKMRTKMQPEDLRDMANGVLLNTVGGIRNKTYPIKFYLADPYSPTSKLHKVVDGAFDPINQVIYYTTINGAQHTIQIDEKNKKIISSAEPILEDILFRNLAINYPQSKRDPVPEVEDDGLLAKYLKRDTIPSASREELDFIQDSRKIFVNSVNSAIRDIQGRELHYNLQNADAVRKRLQLDAVSTKLNARLDQLRRMKASPNEMYNAYFDLVRQAYLELNADFKEADHTILAHMVATIAGNHLFVYGPPGGAKTALGRIFFMKTLESMNASLDAEVTNFENKVLRKFREVMDEQRAKGDPNAGLYELWLRQFHKMVGEGEIIGHPKLNEQLEHGRTEYDRSQSASHPRFMFYILDEVEKGNPALLMTLLSLLNEREVFAGHEVVKASLITAVMTSNKVPAEFIESFGDDESSGRAFFDRAMQKVLVMNKMINPQNEIDMLMAMQAKSFNPHLTAQLPLVELHDLVGQVKISPRIRNFLLNVREQFAAAQLKKHEMYAQAKKEDPFTDVYLPATQSTNRTIVALVLEQFKASYLLNQILEGKKIEEISFEPTWKDVGLFAQGLTFWGPGRIEAQPTSDGYIAFKYVDQGIDALANSRRNTDRVKFQLERIKDEGETFADIATSLIGQMMRDHRELIAKHPELFPELFSSDQSHETWMRSQGFIQ